MRLKKKAKSLLLLSLSIILVLSACSGGSSSPTTAPSGQSNTTAQAGATSAAPETTGNTEAPKELVIYGIDTLKETDYDFFFSDFEKANNCKITYIGSPSDKYAQMLMVAINGNQAIDALSINGQNARAFYKMGLVEDLTDQITFWDRFHEGGYAPLTFNNRQFYVPSGPGTTSAFYYNKEIFEEYGLEPPETIDDLLAIANTLDGTGISAITNGGATTYMWPIWFFEMLNQTSGGKALERTIEVMENKAKWTDPVFVEAMSALQTIGTGKNVFQLGFNGQDQDAGLANLTAGKAAMWYGLSSRYYSFVDSGLNLGATMLPMINEGNTLAATGGPFSLGLGIYKGIREENRELVLKLFDYMSDVEFGLKIVEKSPRPPLLTNKDLGDVELRDDVVRILKERISPTVVVYLDWYYPPEITTAIQQQIQAVTGGQISAENAMIEMQKVQDELFANGYDYNETE